MSESIGAVRAAIAATPTALAVDTTGAIYLTGTAGVALPATTGVVQPANAGGSCLSADTGAGPCSDAFVLKLSADGAKVIYSTYLGGTDQDTGRSIAVNAGGEAYIAGDTASANFPTTPGASQTRFGGRVPGDLTAYGEVEHAPGPAQRSIRHHGCSAIDNGVEKQNDITAFDALCLTTAPHGYDINFKNALDSCVALKFFGRAFEILGNEFLDRASFALGTLLG